MQPMIDIQDISKKYRISAAAPYLSLRDELVRGARLGALEKQVLQEMGQAGLLCRLVARACADPHAGRGGAQVGQTLHGDGQSVAELLQFGGVFNREMLDHFHILR